MSKFTRRRFLSETSMGVTGVALGGVALSALSASNVLGANERVRFALIGCGGRGGMVARNLIDEGAELTHLCDLHPQRLQEMADAIGQAQKQKPALVKDMKAVFDSKDVDAVLVATPDHWHAPASVMACQAGKDVYVEKPHAYDVWESRQLIKAARKYDRIVQVGSQNRSAEYNYAARDYIQSGKIGTVSLAKVYSLKKGDPFYLKKSKNPPEGFDWNTWLGPAPVRPYSDTIFYWGWHHFWDYSGGDLADDGIHQLDLALMLQGDPGIPSKVSCTGGRMVHKNDDSEVPDVQIVTFEFEKMVMTFELTTYPKYMRKTTSTIRRNDLFPYWTQNATRIELYGSDMMMTVGRHGGGWQVMTEGGKVYEQMYGRFPDAPHARNFINCVKSRKRSPADVEILHNAITMVSLANIAHRVGNETLHYDSKAERIINNEQANKLLKREYRNSFSIPDQV